MMQDFQLCNLSCTCLYLRQKRSILQQWGSHINRLSPKLSKIYSLNLHNKEKSYLNRFYKKHHIKNHYNIILVIIISTFCALLWLSFYNQSMHLIPIQMIMWNLTCILNFCYFREITFGWRQPPKASSLCPLELVWSSTTKTALMWWMMMARNTGLTSTARCATCTPHPWREWKTWSYWAI